MNAIKWKLAASAVLSIGVVATGAGVLAQSQKGDEPSSTKSTVPLKVASVPELDQPGRHVVEINGDQVTLDGDPVTMDKLTQSFRSLLAIKDAPGPWVLMRVSSQTPYSDLIRVVDVIKAAGIADIRFENATDSIEGKLNRRINLKLGDVPFSQALAVLNKLSDLRINCDPKVLTGRKLTMDSPVSLNATDLPLRTALKLLLQPFDLTYRVDVNAVEVILPEMAPEKALAEVLKNYDQARKKLISAQQVARDPNDPAIVLNRKRVAELGAILEQVNKALNGVEDQAPKAIKPQPVANSGRKLLPKQGQGIEPPRELDKVSMPEYVVEAPDIIVVEVLQALPGRPITGEHLVRPDGKISLGFYGEVYVAGLTPTEIKAKVILHLRDYINDETLGLTVTDSVTGEVKPVEPARSSQVFVDVASYSSKVYYVSGEVGVPGRLPHTGNETVLDAINYAGGLSPMAARDQIRLVRPAPNGTNGEQTLVVDLAAILDEGKTRTNYQLLPGDRLIVARDPKLVQALKLDANTTAALEARIEALERKLEEVLKASKR